MEKYGAKYAISSSETRKKINKTVLEKYGVKNVSELPSVRQKANDTMYKNKTAPASSQQIYLHSLIGGELNYPCNNAILDIAFPEENIYVEYDGGGYWLSIKFENETHDEFVKRSMNRWYAMYRDGWKQIRIISKKDKLPHAVNIIEMVDFAKLYLSEGHSWIEFDLDNQSVKSSQFNKTYDFGEIKIFRNKNKK